MPKQDESIIIESHRIAAQIKKAEMARVLGISRQALHNYLSGTQPVTETVMEWFRHGEPDWVREMALEIFVRRPELERPCICLEQIGDNGPCPRHAATLVDEA